MQEQINVGEVISLLNKKYESIARQATIINKNITDAIVKPSLMRT